MVRSSSVIATPPGATIKEQLNEIGMSQKEFAARMNMSEKHISKLVNGEVQLTSEMAVKLELVLGVPAKFWNNLEAIYREKLIKVESENAMEKDMSLAQLLPYSEMAGLGWIIETNKLKEKVFHLRQYFGVVELSLLEDKRITNIACRRLTVSEKKDFALLAWVQEAKIIARNIITSPVNINKLKRNVSKIRKLTIYQPEMFCPEIKKILADCGIALVFLPYLKGSLLEGVTFEDGKKIVIGLTIKGQDSDKFWLSLFHEIAHILLGHLEKKDGTTGQDEMNADAWAWETLVPEKPFNEFVKQSFFTKNSICTFSGSVGAAPGIVVGRLQSEGFLKHSEMNELKERYDMQ